MGPATPSMPADPIATPNSGPDHTKATLERRNRSDEPLGKASVHREAWDADNFPSRRPRNRQRQRSARDINDCKCAPPAPPTRSAIISPRHWERRLTCPSIPKRMLQADFTFGDWRFNHLASARHGAAVCADSHIVRPLAIEQPRHSCEGGPQLWRELCARRRLHSSPKGGALCDPLRRGLSGNPDLAIIQTASRSRARGLISTPAFGYCPPESTCASPNGPEKVEGLKQCRETDKAKRFTDKGETHEHTASRMGNWRIA